MLPNFRSESILGEFAKQNISDQFSNASVDTNIAAYII